MSTLTVSRTYADGAILGEINLDNAFDSVSAFVNGGLISAENIQDNSITAAEIQTATITNAKIAPNAVSTAKIQDGSITLAKLAADVIASVTPTGSVNSYAGDTAPSGWLMCDGTPASRITYATLFALVGIRFGQGDGTTTFNTPDLRGRFLRGVDGGSTRDPDAASRTAMNTGGATGSNVGSLQADDIALTDLRANIYDGSYVGGGSPTSTITTTSNGSNTTAQIFGGSSETRPKNAYFNFIIKA